MPFSSEWLALREPADQKARDQNLLARAVEAAGEAPVILDLGCGTGSTLRAMSALLPENTIWHLVDNDPELLEIAAAQLPGNTVTHQIDIADVEKLPLSNITLLTGSALLDLVSRDWLAALANRLQASVYFALSYDGEMRWDPGDWRDEEITEAFNNHQRSDKGFGVAMGPDSVVLASQVFANAGYEVFNAKSDWVLGQADSQLQSALVSGIASAAREAGSDKAQAWGRERVLASGACSCIIGHGDLLALHPKTLNRAHDAAN